MFVARTFSAQINSHPRKGGNKGKTGAPMELKASREVWALARRCSPLASCPQGSSFPRPGPFPRGSSHALSADLLLSHTGRAEATKPRPTGS